jgi:HEPN domain-containing protein
MKEYEKWFKKAESDLLNIENNLSAKNVSIDTVCFHAQQVAEKYLKAYLISKGIEFPKTHDIELLLNQCSNKNIHFLILLTQIKNLNDYAIIPRYPDEVDDLTIEDAKQAYADAIDIKQFILKHFFE